MSSKRELVEKAFQGQEVDRVQAAYGYQYFEAYAVIFIVYLLLCGFIQ